jgi:cell division septum initiation protein DivIVA
VPPRLTEEERAAEARYLTATLDSLRALHANAVAEERRLAAEIERAEEALRAIGENRGDLLTP